MIFDYTLIFGEFGFPEMGIQGAAIATIASWGFVFIGMGFLLIQDRLIDLKMKSQYSIKEIIREIFSLGTPTIVTQIVGPITITFLTFLLARQSPMAVAAFGVASRIEMLLMIGILAVSTAITPFIAQNSGAKATDRIDEAIVFGGKASTYLGLLVAIILFLFIEPIAGVFTEDLSIIGYTTTYFYMVSLSYVLYALFLVTTAIFNGPQLTMKSLQITVVKSFIFTIPMTFIGSYWGVSGIFIGLAVSNVFAGIFAASRMRKEFKETHSELGKVNVFVEHGKDIKRLFGTVVDK